MKNLAKRVADLETRGGSDAPDAVHQLFRMEDENEEAVIDAYGRDKIGPNDMVIMLVGVSPRFDADGGMEPRNGTCADGSGKAKGL